MRVVVPVEGGKLTLSDRKCKGELRIYCKATADSGDPIEELEIAAQGMRMLRAVLAERGLRPEMVGIRWVDDHK